MLLKVSSKLNQLFLCFSCLELFYCWY